MEQPKTIKRAIFLLWIVVGIAVAMACLSTIFPGFGQANILTSSIGILTVMVSCGFLIFMIWKIRCGKNWARILYTVIFFSGLVSWGFLPELIPPLTNIEGILAWNSTALQVYVLYLLWTKPGTFWFKSY